MESINVAGVQLEVLEQRAGSDDGREEESLVSRMLLDGGVEDVHTEGRLLRI